MHDVLRRALADHLRAPHEGAPANFSLKVAEDDAGGRTKDFHLLYRGVTSVLRTRDLRRLVDGLLSYLSAVVEQPDGRTLRLDVLAFVKDGRAVLAPAEIRNALPNIERRLRAKGLRVVDRPFVTVDPDAAELVLAPPQLSVDTAVIDEVAPGGPDGGVEPGRYPIGGWGFGVGPGQSGAISRALAVTLAGARLVDRDPSGAQQTLEALATMLAAVEPVALWADRPDDLVGPVARLAG